MAEKYARTERTIMALGNFDGVHLGHKAVIEETINLARDTACQSSVLLLEPHPFMVLAQQREAFLLTSVAERCKILRGMGIDHILIETFDRDFARLKPETFVASYLKGRYKVEGIVAGYDYTFGSGGKGTSADLKSICVGLGIKALIVQPVMVNGEIVCSSNIRQKLLQGEVEKAAQLLGHEYYVTGTVVHGQELGRKLGFPTANIEVDRDILMPKRGVYLVRVKYKDSDYSGLLNFGVRPTVSGQNTTIEIHILDFSAALYGKEITVAFLVRLRDEIAFKSIEDLKAQIKADKKEGERLLKANKTLFPRKKQD